MRRLTDVALGLAMTLGVALLFVSLGLLVLISPLVALYDWLVASLTRR